MVTVLLVICRRTACSRLALAHQCRCVQLTVSTKLVPDTATLELVLFYKESVLSAGTVVVAHKSTEGVRTKASFQALAVPRDGYINTVMHL